ncbi:MAG TPA: M1 family metallopeptidase [Longimicrobiales bacterium]|nr:M1 family metallopeptidase [Longimicrobiales bacterium]
MRRWGWSIVVAMGACAAPVQPPPAPVPVEPEVVVEPERPRHAVRPLPVTNAFLRAVERGTRTHDGHPGPDYWQQRVEYRIEAELDPADAMVQGEQVVMYRNNSPDTLHSILMHLYQNAFSEGVQRVRRVPMTGGVTIRRVAVNDVEIDSTSAPAGSGRYRVDGTLMWVDLARPLAPGASLELEVGWSFIVPPPGAPRTGHSDNEAFVVAQWYPQVAVYDDLHGWHDLPYWTNGEFYLEYGDFEVLLTVPEGWLVTATGELDNAAEVLTDDVRQRLARALEQDEIVNVVTLEDIEQQRVTAREPGGHLTWRFRARDVRDFAFATSDRYVWDATHADWSGASGERPVLVNALYRPDASRAWSDAARYMRHALSFFAERWGPYIYPHISAAEGPVGGMEYPMLVFIGGSRTPQSLYSVLSHEIAHEWWPMMVGSNETLYAWQDEGLASYIEDLSLRDYFEGETPALSTQGSYLRIAGSDAERPIMTAPDLFGTGPQYGVAAYTKPATLLRALGAVVGEDVLHRGLREYTTRWLLRHPSPYDFFNVMEDVHGSDLDWFWTPWFFDTAVLDQAITDVDIESAAGGERVSVTVEDMGEAPMPVLLTFTLADGSTMQERLPVDTWLEGAETQTVSVDVPSQVMRVEIDPDRYLPDVERANNVWTRQ